MGRPRAFDEAQVVAAAVSLFASRAYDGISVDDLVTHLGVHRNSLYKTFGSKRGLYLAALRWYLEHQVRPLLRQVAANPDPARTLYDRFLTDDATPDLDLLLIAMVERAPVDDEVADEVTRVLREFDDATAAGVGGDATAPLTRAASAAILGLQLRARIGDHADGAGPALFDRIDARP
jgi:TetR/AcrR family transcriptional repressor of nem operon